LQKQSDTIYTTRYTLNIFVQLFIYIFLTTGHTVKSTGSRRTSRELSGSGFLVTATASSSTWTTTYT